MNNALSIQEGMGAVTWSSNCLRIMEAEIIFEGDKNTTISPAKSICLSKHDSINLALFILQKTEEERGIFNESCGS